MHVEFGYVVEICALEIVLSLPFDLALPLPFVWLRHWRSFSIGVFINFEEEVDLLLSEFLYGVIFLVCLFFFEDGLESVHFRVPLSGEDHLDSPLFDDHFVLLGYCGLEVVWFVAHHQ